MNKIINGKRYNTDSADKIAQWDNKLAHNDFDYCAETLYRKKTGEFFLFGEGGGRSRYAENNGDGWWGYGERIITLSDEAAREWAENHLDGDDYLRIFGEIENEEIQAGFKITRAESDKLKSAARAANMTQLAFIKRWIETL